MRTSEVPTLSLRKRVNFPLTALTLFIVSVKHFNSVWSLAPYWVLNVKHSRRARAKRTPTSAFDPGTRRPARTSISREKSLVGQRLSTGVTTFKNVKWTLCARIGYTGRAHPPPLGVGAPHRILRLVAGMRLALWFLTHQGLPSPRYHPGPTAITTLTC